MSLVKFFKISSNLQKYGGYTPTICLSIQKDINKQTQIKQKEGDWESIFSAFLKLLLEVFPCELIIILYKIN